MQCEKCGNLLADDATFCTACGWKTSNWHRKVKSGKEKHIVLIVSLVFLLAVLIVLFVNILNLTTY